MQGCRRMKHFKSLKPGMSLIEVIAAIAVLAVFGSSLFMMQQYLFDRLIISQRKVIANLRMHTELITYQTNILKEFFEQGGSVEKSLQEQTKEFTQPDMTVKITMKSDLAAVADQKESPFKNFKNVHLVCVSASADAPGKTSGDAAADVVNELARNYLFVYIPEVAKK